MDNIEAFLKLEEKLKTISFNTERIYVYPLPDYDNNILYTEIDVSKLNEEELNILKKNIYEVGFKWQSGNFIKNRKDKYITMISDIKE